MGAPGAVCAAFVDEPRAWVFVLAARATCAEAAELGRALGREGHQGRFVSGDTAEAWRRIYIEGARRPSAGEEGGDGERQHR